MASKISRDKDTHVQEFKFGQLSPSQGKGVVTSYKPENFKDPEDFKRKISDETLRSEREFEKNSSFKISGMVREHRGIRAQEDADFERRVEEEVIARLNQIEAQAKEAGYNAGLELGRNEAFENASHETNEIIESLTSEIERVQSESVKVFEDNKDRAYSIIKNLVKWVSLKEISDEGYLPKLLEKLILEINTRANLIIRVNPERFQAMPEIIEKVQARVGTLTNVRLEIKQDLHYDGIILESENGIIDGSLEAQFDSIDRIFEKVGVIDHDNS